jgi:hypothetical protein
MQTYYNICIENCGAPVSAIFSPEQFAIGLLPASLKSAQNGYKKTGTSEKYPWKDKGGIVSEISFEPPSVTARLLVLRPNSIIIFRQDILHQDKNKL